MSLHFGAVFQDNCASSLSFSIFTQNDAGSGSGGAGEFWQSAMPSGIPACSNCTNACTVLVSFECCSIQCMFPALPVMVPFASSHGGPHLWQSSSQCDCRDAESIVWSEVTGSPRELTKAVNCVMLCLQMPKTYQHLS